MKATGVHEMIDERAALKETEAGIRGDKLLKNILERMASQIEGLQAKVEYLVDQEKLKKS